MNQLHVIHAHIREWTEMYRSILQVTTNVRWLRSLVCVCVCGQANKKKKWQNYIQHLLFSITKWCTDYDRRWLAIHTRNKLCDLDKQNNIRHLWDRWTQISWLSCGQVPYSAITLLLEHAYICTLQQFPPPHPTPYRVSLQIFEYEHSTRLQQLVRQSKL